MGTVCPTEAPKKLILRALLYLNWFRICFIWTALTTEYWFKTIKNKEKLFNITTSWVGIKIETNKRLLPKNFKGHTEEWDVLRLLWNILWWDRNRQALHMPSSRPGRLLRSPPADPEALARTPRCLLKFWKTGPQTSPESFSKSCCWFDTAKREGWKVFGYLLSCGWMLGLLTSILKIGRKADE